MRVVYLITDRQGSMCGITDYTTHLSQAVAKQKVEVGLEIMRTWSFKALWDLKRKYRGQKDIIFHLQYPTFKMGISPAPSLIPLLFYRNKTLATLHEFGQLHKIRKLYLLFFQLLKKTIIFTNEPERQRFERFFKIKNPNLVIIKVGNNINVVPVEQNAPRAPRLIYFGQIVKNKGIDEFIEVVKLLRARGNHVKCTVMGALMGRELEIAEQVEAASKAYDIECLFNLSAEDVSRQLSASTIALLPFAEGVSDKRGSALACLKHGVAVITHHTDITPAWWLEATYDIKTPENAATLIENIIAEKIPGFPNKEILANALQQSEWSYIASEHIKLYAGLKA